MRKIVSILLVLVLTFSVVYADDSLKDSFVKDYTENATAYTGIGKSFKPVDAAAMGRGGAGIALMDSSYAMFYNPAQLGENEFKLSLPSVGLTVYHPYALLKQDSNGKSALDKILDSVSSSDSNAIFNAISPILDVIGTQFAPLTTMDAAVGLTLPFGIGLGVYVSDTAYTYDTGVINELDVSASLGYGYKLNFGSSLSLSLGTAVKFNALAFNQRIKASTFMSGDPSNITVGLASGWAPIMDFGVTAQYKAGLSTLSVGAVYSDLNLLGGYKMDVTKFSVSTVSDDVKECATLDRNGDIVIKGEGNLSAGLGYVLDLKFLKLKAAADVNDILGLISSNSTLSGRILLKHVNAGLELSLADTIVVRGGLNSGYYTLGASLDIFAIRVDAAYFWKEMGSYAGERGLDGLTIRFNLGYDR